VVDPASGSYYIENLTDSIIGEAWKLFLEIHELGGFIAAFKKGFVQERIKSTSQKRDLAIATRKEVLLGTNQYPNFTEKIASELDLQVFQPADFTMENAIAETLKPYRGAQAFEALRYKTDMFSLGNKRPAVFMLTFGSLAMRRARSQFSGNFFACAGFEIIDNNGFKTVDEGVAAALASKAEFVVVCAADDDYPVIGPEIFNKIKGKANIVIAGYPKDSVDALKIAGINYFIHVKSNVLETLMEFQKMVGIA
jgi:methylmalonyl-CoA mutase